MFQKILVANRGEIAVRVIRACKEMDIETVAVFSEADRQALHTQMADVAVCIGGNSSAESYLNMQNIISAAHLTNAQAIHPGFGFLSENTVFATMCKDCNITFIGPEPDAIEAMGNKSNARNVMKAAGVPVIPGSDGPVESWEEAKKLAVKIGYPVMLKASAGGGGKGIRKCHNEAELQKNFETAKTEAKANFGDDTLYIEKVIVGARHIEVQVLGDSFGKIIHLGERDCSVQRRNQKMIEEAPSVVVDDKIRRNLGKTAVKAAKAVNYRSAGTVEFLYNDEGFYFMEMNTRIQVEHPVTEMLTQIDIVKEQIRIAAGEKLLLKQEDIRLQGHAIECRINAEDPENNFCPSPGNIHYALLPSGGIGLRVESAIYPGYTIPPFYDSMIAKIITHGHTRQEAILKMKRALGELIIRGIATNTDLHLEILNHPQFVSGDVDTLFLEEMLKDRGKRS